MSSFYVERCMEHAWRGGTRVWTFESTSVCDRWRWSIVLLFGQSLQAVTGSTPDSSIRRVCSRNVFTLISTRTDCGLQTPGEDEFSRLQ